MSSMVVFVVHFSRSAWSHWNHTNRSYVVTHISTTGVCIVRIAVNSAV